jgi:hypothetical protein
VAIGWPSGGHRGSRERPKGSGDEVVPWVGRGETRDIDGALVPARSAGRRCDVSMEPPERRDGGCSQCAGMACILSRESLSVRAGPWRLGAAASWSAGGNWSAIRLVESRVKSRDDSPFGLERGSTFRPGGPVARPRVSPGLSPRYRGSSEVYLNIVYFGIITGPGRGGAAQRGAPPRAPPLRPKARLRPRARRGAGARALKQRARGGRFCTVALCDGIAGINGPNDRRHTLTDRVARR